jgi:hypothetical protein
MEMVLWIPLVLLRARLRFRVVLQVHERCLILRILGDSCCCCCSRHRRLINYGAGGFHTSSCFALCPSQSVSLQLGRAISFLPLSGFFVRLLSSFYVWRHQLASRWRPRARAILLRALDKDVVVWVSAYPSMSFTI